jgi:hypothetical protein
MSCIDRITLMVLGAWQLAFCDEHVCFIPRLLDCPLAEWGVSSVTEMRGMFLATSFDPPLGDWNVSSVRDMSDMFLTRLLLISRLRV